MTSKISSELYNLVRDPTSSDIHEQVEDNVPFQVRFFLGVEIRDLMLNRVKNRVWDPINDHIIRS